jgi:hypothetical protein
MGDACMGVAAGGCAGLDSMGLGYLFLPGPGSGSRWESVCNWILQSTYLVSNLRLSVDPSFRLPFIGQEIQLQIEQR